MRDATMKSPAKKPVEAVTEESSDFVPASCGLPPDVHAKITKVADREERTFAAQLRMIAKEWAAKQP